MFLVYNILGSWCEKKHFQPFFLKEAVLEGGDSKTNVLFFPLSFFVSFGSPSERALLIKDDT